MMDKILMALLILGAGTAVPYEGYALSDDWNQAGNWQAMRDQLQRIQANGGKPESDKNKLISELNGLGFKDREDCFSRSPYLCLGTRSKVKNYTIHTQIGFLNLPSQTNISPLFFRIVIEDDQGSYLNSTVISPKTAENALGQIPSEDAKSVEGFTQGDLLPYLKSFAINGLFDIKQFINKNSSFNYWLTDLPNKIREDEESYKRLTQKELIEGLHFKKVADNDKDHETYIRVFNLSSISVIIRKRAFHAVRVTFTVGQRRIEITPTWKSSTQFNIPENIRKIKELAEAMEKNSTETTPSLGIRI